MCHDQMIYLYKKYENNTQPYQLRNFIYFDS